MGIVLWIVFGLIAGALAKFLMPGKQPGGIVLTTLLGIAGAVVGGFIGTQLGFGDVNSFDLRSMAIAVGGALLVLVIWGFATKQMA
jgi:uncharacterized membrane protein YeaQ/YmgE (transglycosylase-associated protein family)